MEQFQFLQKKTGRDKKSKEHHYQLLPTIKKTIKLWLKELYIINCHKLKIIEISTINELQITESDLFKTRNIELFFTNYPPLKRAQINALQNIINNRLEKLRNEIEFNEIFKDGKKNFWDYKNMYAYHSFGKNITAFELLIQVGWRIIELLSEYTEEDAMKINSFFNVYKENFISQIETCSKEDGKISLITTFIYDFFAFFTEETHLHIQSMQHLKTIPIFTENSRLHLKISPFKVIPFSKESILPYLLSNTVLSAYFVLLEKKEVPRKRYEIEKMVKTVFEKTHFFFLESKLEIYGCVIENGSIYLRNPKATYLNIIPITESAILLSTIIHEVGHAILKIAYKGNFFQPHPSFSEDDTMDSGSFVETLLYDTNTIINVNQAMFMLDINNYNYNYSKYNVNFNKVQKNKKDAVYFRKRDRKYCGTLHNSP